MCLHGFVSSGQLHFVCKSPRLRGEQRHLRLVEDLFDLFRHLAGEQFSDEHGLRRQSFDDRAPLAGR